MLYTAVIVAGGTGTRMGSRIPKQFLELLGKPILMHTVQKFLALGDDVLLSLVLHPSTFERWEEAAQAFLTEAERKRVFLCEGGASRTESVFAGLKRLQEVVDRQKAVVGIHDGVRPLVTQEILENAYQMAGEKGSAVVCVPVKSSIREQTQEGSRAVDRSRFFHVQTPQCFRFGEIMNCFEQRPHNEFTDDASLFEAAGNAINIAIGSYDNLKITTPIDLLIAEKLLGA